MRTGRMKRGFTLIETVVTVGIVAAMAAVVIPQVAKQFDASDSTSMQQDLKNLQTAIQTFAVNTRGVLPGDMDDLANPLTTGADLTVVGVDTAITGTGTLVVFGAATTLWKGPYIDASVLNGATKTSGYGATILDNFVCYTASGTDANAVTDIGTNNDQQCADLDADERIFHAIRITGLGDETDARFLAINALFDGASETNPELNGLIRNVTIATVPTTFFLAAPLN